jgi:ABC-type transport system substrate-binding protein
VENDRLMEQVIGEMDPAQPTVLLRQHQALFAEELPSLPLFFGLSLTSARKEIRNVKPVGLAGSYLPWNAGEWAWGDQ